ncbi:MAG: hypothetical protein EU549_03410 [Promethearchaeota archaeon]|nr:MAG: hypothetical protein EU549_03410 [Candidatus Lokiarchaeota archaeon]
MPKRTTYKKIAVDFWATDLHGEEIGIRQQDQHRAKSRQFSKDMEIYGGIKEDEEKSGFIGWRKEAWKSGIDEEPEEEEGVILGPSTATIGRLVIKAFSDKSNWQGTLEEQVSMELPRSYYKPMPTFTVILPRFEFLIRIERIYTYMGHLYVTSIITEEKGDEKIMDMFEIEEKLWTFGSDWVVRRRGAEKKDIVAKIDGKVLNIGGKTVVKIFDEKLAKNRVFRMLVTLFAALTKHHGKVKKKIKKTRQQILDGEIKIEPTHQELELMRNPRSIRR